ncbi:hypothetical protein BD310DRAFT_681807 [Dichomitus squalens]|uniref:DUF8212 domain-containing protein n=1 Tax=Dichomitus squalens TaxID=114155 RepID=A0A4Q9PMY0_9APHY|nr:hypothetical protein BD310DRAFT_681807 [Dichomitus squalens]
MVGDEAYSVMGIFGITIVPALYAERHGRAFMRLQEAISKHVPAQSLIAWGTIYMSSPAIQAEAAFILKGLEYRFDLVNEAPGFLASPPPSSCQHTGSIRGIPSQVTSRNLELAVKQSVADLHQRTCYNPHLGLGMADASSGPSPPGR